MPIRLLREGILNSDRIEQLDAPAEVFYRRLMSKVDDFGLYDARPSILRASLYPLRIDRVREADIARWIAACEKAGVIALYQHDGKPYMQMLDTGWQTRSEPKFPLPPWGKGKPTQPAANGCEQPKTIAPVFVDAVGDGDVVEKEKPARKRADTFPKPDDVDAQVWSDWLALRKAKRATVSATVLEEARKEAGKADLSLESFLRIWCVRGSQGLLAEWLKPNERPAQATGSFRERDAAAKSARIKEVVGNSFDRFDDPNTIDMEISNASIPTLG